MKPISLVIDGINSFYDRQEVDLCFDGLFCICGDTGSGKTTILDCIIIALYGSGKRSALTSDYINLRRDRAEIRLTFEITLDDGRKTFEVTRILSRDGAAKAKLINLTDGVTVAEQVTAVNKALESMIGLTREDFTQVVILEQGKFNKFLTATKSERNETVGNLFKLHKYKNLGSKFGDKRNSVKLEIDNLDKRLDELKDVTLAAVTDKEKVVSAGSKRIEQLTALQVELDTAIEKLEADKRKFVESEEASKKLAEVKAQLKTYCDNLAALKSSLDEAGGRLKAASEEKLRRELGQERTKDYESMKEQLVKREEELSALRLEWKETDNKLRLAESEFKEGEAMEIKLSERSVKQRQELFSLVNLGEKDEYFDAFDIKSKIDGLLDKLSSERKAYESCDKKVASLSEKLQKESDAVLLALKKSNELQKRCDSLRAEQSELKARLERQRLEEAAAFVRSGLSEGDVCPVCGGTICGEFHQRISEEINLDEKEAELRAAENEFNDIEKYRFSHSSLYEETRKLLSDAQVELQTCGNNISKICETITVPDKIDFLRELTSSLCQTQTELNKLSSQNALLKHKMQTATERAEEVRTRGEALKAEADKLRSTIAERFNVEEMIKNSERIKELASICDTLAASIREDEAKRDLLAASIASLDASAKLLEAKASEKPLFDERELVEKIELSKSSKAERDALIASVAGGEKELETMRRDLERKRSLEAEKSQLKDMYDIYSDIYKLVSGDKFIEYIAEEYILQFTQSASVVLGDITGGKYTLEYEDGAFYVKDFLAGGMMRKVGTLSGGETFLASLSLAIAISREIARYKTYEFFFLDEGFGTLDSGSIDTVVSALQALSADTLVGVVTHRSELTDAIFDKITVLPADETRGSMIVRSD